MAIRKFLTSVADVYGYNTETDEIIFTSKTLLDSSIDVALGSTPVHGGRGAQLPTRWQASPTHNRWLWRRSISSMTVRMYSARGGGLMAADVVPLSDIGGTTIYGWATKADSSATYRVTFTTGTPWSFVTTGGEILGAMGEYVCVRYFENDAGANYVTVNANIVPKVVRLVMETQLNSADVSSNKIGIVQIIAPTVTLSGAFNIAMKSDGVSNTPLTGTALAYTDPIGTTTPCSIEPYYAKIIEVIDTAVWYDNVIGLTVVGGDFNMTHNTTTTLNVWAVPSSGSAFKAPVADLLFSMLAGSPAGASVAAHSGVVTAATATGPAIVTALISNTTGWTNLPLEEV